MPSINLHAINVQIVVVTTTYSFSAGVSLQFALKTFVVLCSIQIFIYINKKGVTILKNCLFLSDTCTESLGEHSLITFCKFKYNTTVFAQEFN